MIFFQELGQTFFRASGFSIIEKNRVHIVNLKEVSDQIVESSTIKHRLVGHNHDCNKHSNVAQ
eukprot:8423944-Ditylum_brightwellii.AAC.1